MTDFAFTGKTGETLTQKPGTINGESFILKDLNDCTVYLLDYTSEVEVTSCVDCRIFIGPVDGPVLFNNCSSSQVAVACQQFQAKGCKDIDFGWYYAAHPTIQGCSAAWLYCATRPTIQDCSSVRFSCWMGAYPTLSGHFAAANLDPQSNMWDKVYDINGDDSFGGASFELVDGVQYWEVPLEGHGELQNPVPAADGSLYQPSSGATSNRDAGFDGFGDESFGQPQLAQNGISGAGSGGLGSGGLAMGSGRPAMGSGGGLLGGTPRSGPGASPLGAFGDSENPKVAEMREKMRTRLAAQEEAERSAKQSTVEKAANFLEKFYERRNTSKSSREKQNREEEKLVTVAGPKGDTEWERTIDYINFGFQRPNGTDLARMKSLLFTAKSKAVPVSARI